MLANYLDSKNRIFHHTSKQFSQVPTTHSSEKEADTNAILTNLDEYNVNPFLANSTKNLRPIPSLKDTIKLYHKRERSLLRHLPMDAPIKQSYTSTWFKPLS